MPAKIKESQKSTFKDSVEPDIGAPVSKPDNLEPEKDLFTWTAPARPFKRRNREFWVTVISIASITSIVLFLAEGVMPVILVVSLLFLFYVLTTVEPEKIEYKITNYGIKIADKKTEWNLINRFWFSKRFDDTLLVFETRTLTGRLEFVILPYDKDKIKSFLSKYVREEESAPSRLDKLANWLSKKLPQG